MFGWNPLGTLYTILSNRVNLRQARERVDFRRQSGRVRATHDEPTRKASENGNSRNCSSGSFPIHLSLSFSFPPFLPAPGVFLIVYKNKNESAERRSRHPWKPTCNLISL